MVYCFCISKLKWQQHGLYRPDSLWVELHQDANHGSWKNICFIFERYALACLGVAYIELLVVLPSERWTRDSRSCPPFYHQSSAARNIEGASPMLIPPLSGPSLLQVQLKNLKSKWPQKTLTKIHNSKLKQYRFELWACLAKCLRLRLLYNSDNIVFGYKISRVFYV